jgi:HAD superfamily hydrolase (TIGR01484 family)
VTEQFLRPLAEMPLAVRRQIRFVLCDIDDTLTLEGRLPACAYAALEHLRQADFTVIPVTGRPAGWCDHIARMWPVDAVVGENGAFYFRHDDASRRMLREYWNEATRGDERRRLDEIARQILLEVPGAAVAADQSYRETDLAIDYCEDVSPLGAEAVARIVAIFEAAGATAKVSSIHVNGWFGDHDKRKHGGAPAARRVRPRPGRRSRARSCSSAIRPTMPRCSPGYPIRSAWPMSWISPTPSTRRRPG